MQMSKSVVPLAASGHGGEGPGEQAEARHFGAVPPPARAQPEGPRQAQAQAQRARRGAFVPLLLMALALLLAFGFQAAQLLRERQALQDAHAGQQQTVDNAGKLRASLDALAADTQRLADAGNANAALLVNELRKRGITINPAAQAAAPAPAPVASGTP
ncbi:MAG TPA: hypothetical protein PLZ50_03680 [Rubrivivax sp.]|nr:hypothetical protein [Rubrivivax sp.]